MITRVPAFRLLLPLRINGFIASAVLAVVPTGLGVQEADCGEAQTQVAMSICAGRDLEEADRELNRVCGELRTALRDRQLEPRLRDIGVALVAGQRGRIGYRDGHCVVAGSEARGASMEPPLVPGYGVDLPRHRT